MILVAPTRLELAPEELAREARARFGPELRRLGVFTQLCLLGADTCVEASATRGSLGVLLATAHGARSAVRSALGEDWPRLQRLAGEWLADCERVALGWVEEGGGGAPHLSRWELALRS